MAQYGDYPDGPTLGSNSTQGRMIDKNSPTIHDVIEELERECMGLSERLDKHEAVIQPVLLSENVSNNTTMALAEEAREPLSPLTDKLIDIHETLKRLGRRLDHLSRRVNL